MANTITPTIFIGKGELKDNIIKQVEIELEKREIIKGKIQQNCDLSPKEVCHEICDKTNAYPVQVIGRSLLFIESLRRISR